MGIYQPTVDDVFAARALCCRESFGWWCRYVLKRLGQKPAEHHDLLIAELEALERGEFDRLMILMPPGSAKSTFASMLLPCWWLCRRPADSLIAASHTAELAERFGRKVRNLILEHARVLNVAVRSDNAAAGRWETTAAGEYFAAGVGGPITGRRADLALIDDPVKSRAEAYSETVRERVWDWYRNDLVTRLKPNAKVVLIMTRWHEDDLGGRVLKDMEAGGRQWRVLKLPMEAEAQDPLGRKPGDRLWREWFTEDMVAEAKRDPRTWSALYQQNPAPDEGGYFKAEWLKHWSERPSNVHIYGTSDYAVTDDGGDYTVHRLWAVDERGKAFRLGGWRGQTASDRWIEEQIDLIDKWKPLAWFGEAGVIAKAIEPALKRRMRERKVFCRLEWIPSIHDKATRARGIQARMAMGMVEFEPGAQLSEFLSFPAGAFDDDVDTASLMGRALDEAHPALAAPDHIRKPSVKPFSSQWLHNSTNVTQAEKARQLL